MRGPVVVEADARSRPAVVGLGTAEASDRDEGRLPGFGEGFSIAEAEMAGLRYFGSRP